MPRGGSKIKEDLTGRRWLSRVVLGKAERYDTKRGPKWRVLCRACDRIAEISRADIIREKDCKRCAAIARAEQSTCFFPRSAAGKRHVDRLHERVWPRVCKTCGQPFTGTARQQYCCREHRPSAGG